MTGKWAVIALAVSMLAAPAYGAQARKKAPEPPPPPPQFRVDVATRSMALERMTLSMPASSSVGEIGRGLGCRHRTPILVGDAFYGLSSQDFAKIFASEASLAGYHLAASQKDMFSTGDAAKPELIVGAAITGLTQNACVPLANVIYWEAKLDATVKVEWQVYDPLEQKIVYRGTSEGITTLRKPGNTDHKMSVAGEFSLMAPEVTRGAFQQAAKIILTDPNLVAAVRDPKGGPPAQDGALFPEAQNAAPAAPPPVQIIRLPLNAKPFKDQVTQLRDQVVTVLTPGGQGSGFYITDGLLLTNHHVIAGYSRVRLRFYGGREVDGEVASSNAKRDIALIKTAGAGVKGLPLRLEPPELAATVFVIGTPARDKNEGSVISGIISAFRDERDGPFIQSDVAVTHGNSGGPMFDDMGNVIGLVDKGDADAAAVNRFIPIADALKVLDIRFAP